MIEQLIVIAVFAICAAACISILTNAYFNARDSRDISNALFAGESVADSFKAYSGDFQRAAEIAGGKLESVNGSEAVVVFFDRHWNASVEGEAVYVLRLAAVQLGSGLLEGSQPNPRLLEAHLTVSRVDGNQLVSFPVVSRLGLSGGDTA